LYLFFFAVFAPATLRKASRQIFMGIAGMFVLLNGLYFFEFIPPIPLALRKAEIAHAISRSPDGVYHVTREVAGASGFFERAQKVHLDGSPLYFFSAVFAPTAFSTSLVHEWQYQEEETGEWNTLQRITFSLVGGRKGGYRGYSLSAQIFPGHWRVRVLTGEGVLIGQKSFVAVARVGEVRTRVVDR
jgi:hypothetical protein